MLEAADAAGQSATIFHWTHPEVSQARRFPALAALLDGRTVDLCDWVRSNYRTRGGYSLKNVAPVFGFEWDVDDAGGSASQTRIEEARVPGPDGEEARQWCLAYNESDVAAQAAIRDGISAWAAAAKSG